MKNISAIALFAMLPVSVAHSQSAEDINAIQTYLNSIKNMSASFIQNASNGNTAEGTLKISKPNKIKMEYADPTSISIIGDGNFIIYHDKELDQTTHINYEDIPASLILANNIEIDNKNIKVTDFYKDAGTTSISLEYTKSKDMGPITLIFSNSPMQLKQWKITDPQDIEVSISLYNTTEDVNFEKDTFIFNKSKKPKYKK